MQFTPGGGHTATTPTTEQPKRFSEETLRRAAIRREESRAVKAYLEDVRNGRTRRRPDMYHRHLAKTNARLEGGDLTVLEEVRLRQRRQELLAAIEAAAHFVDHEPGFVEYGKAWAERNGVSRAALREFGVTARVLRDAGISK